MTRIGKESGRGLFQGNAPCYSEETG